MFEYFNQPEVIKTIVTIGSMTLFAIGLFGLLTQKHFIKIFISIALMENALFIFFIGTMYRVNFVAPILDATHTKVTQMNDPVPHAMILTAIVIGMAVTALGVSMAIEYYKLTANSEIDKMNEMRH
ncbi:MAG: multicomponent Na+:H+ antiporter subunit C [Sulfurimonas sp.]|jgi:multicomponent Na+:H+ antiporter subunit C|uniref:sodium:proton antiporter n=1 Tax=Sulfurimonas sp. TaxID=2022749 RepID=UPI0039E71B47